MSPHAFTVFQERVDVLDDDRSSALRGAFVTRLVDTRSPEAQEQLRVAGRAPD
jgi:hypothetical protein